ncbi:MULTISPECIES: hypothetical protein [unclassified Psychrobacter]|uniref:hypothetical protein n=1 Tax=unclassified Psychrobacter TaxID=196806 RepID=UPI0025B2D0EC|nr:MULTISPECIES: hypothetical protein [unclassified Psychrobacter]MDN3452253.1 hypothetical protein [Psychrobacter sp. APC 3350]MDN3502130.1 hypothetical protein [Psychrobacter sp. 5A.1]
MYQLYKSLSESFQPISDSPVEVLTLCPCPPETSDTALSSNDDVDGGIFIRVYTQHTIDDPLRSEVVFLPDETAE